MSENIHILFFSSWYPNRNHPTHGIFNRHFAKAASMHHKVSVLHLVSEAGLQSEEQVSGQDPTLYERYIYYPKLKFSLPLIGPWLKQQRYLRALEKGYAQVCRKKGKPQLLHCNVALPAGLGALHLKKKFGLPYVLNEGWTGYMKADGSYKGLLQKWLTKKIVKEAARVLPVSEDLKAAMLSHGLKGSYKILPNVIDCNVFIPTPEDSRHSSTTFIHVSTFDPRQKNVAGLLRAFAEAHKQEPQLRLLMVGDGIYRQETEDYCRQLDLQDEVSFTGNLSSEELLPLFHRSLALIMFSNYESFGVVIGEALAAGLPLICSRAGGLSSQLPPELAQVIEAGDEAALCRAMLGMRSNPKAYHNMHMRRFIEERYSPDVIAKQLRQIYSEVLKRNNAD